jgi:hypothetical protein
LICTVTFVFRKYTYFDFSKYAVHTFISFPPKEMFLSERSASNNYCLNILLSLGGVVTAAAAAAAITVVKTKGNNY